MNKELIQRHLAEIKRLEHDYSRNNANVNILLDENRGISTRIYLLLDKIDEYKKNHLLKFLKWYLDNELDFEDDATLEDYVDTFLIQQE